jgi:hypothetical protein
MRRLSSAVISGRPTHRNRSLHGQHVGDDDQDVRSPDGGFRASGFEVFPGFRRRPWRRPPPTFAAASRVCSSVFSVSEV